MAENVKASSDLSVDLEERRVGGNVNKRGTRDWIMDKSILKGGQKVTENLLGCVL